MKKPPIFSLTAAVLYFALWVVIRPLAFYISGDWQSFNWRVTFIGGVLMGITMSFYYGISRRRKAAKALADSSSSLLGV